MKLYVVRHGQTNWNAEHRAQGKVDTNLNSKGIEQAKKVKEILKEKQIDFIISSPLKRAIQTAMVSNEDRKLPILLDDRISERDLGGLQGEKIEEIDFKTLWVYSDRSYKNVESTKELFQRVYTFMESIKKQYMNKHILLVTHGGVSVPIHCYFHGTPKNKDLGEFILENCEIAEYETEE